MKLKQTYAPPLVTLVKLLLITGLFNQSLAADDVASLAQTCAACHGPKGVSTNPAWPHLAGQKDAYIAAQIRAFRDGVRTEPTMLPFVENLSEEQIADLASYFSTLARPGNPGDDSPARAGLDVRARCISCHGMQGLSVNPEWPNIAGQQKAYLIKQLKAYQSGERHDPIMMVIANELNDEQIEAVAEYYSNMAY